MVVERIMQFFLHTDVGLAILNFLIFLVGICVLIKIIIPYFRRKARKTESELDDLLLDIISRPLILVVVLIGLYTSANLLSMRIGFFTTIEKFFIITGALAASWMMAEIFVFFATYWFEREKKVKLPGVVSKVIYLFVFLIGVLTILDYFHVALAPLLTTLGVGSLAIGLALQGTLSDFFAGLHLLSDKPIRVGDFVELEDGTVGYVEDVGWRSTKIRTLADYSVILPNSKIAQSKIINYAMPVKPTNVVVSCGVSYDSDLERVEKIVIEVARDVQKRLSEFCDTSWKPLVRYKNFGDSNIDFSIIVRAKDYAYRYTITHELIKAIKKRFDEEGIEISWPVRKIYFGNKLPTDVRLENREESENEEIKSSGNDDNKDRSNNK